MKKIPTLFKRLYCEDGAVILTREVTEGMEWVLSRRKKEQGVATVKWDGAACAIIDGELYKRYDAKRGKQPPEGAIPCQDPDPVTGHWPHWVKVDPEKPENRWFVMGDKRSVSIDSRNTSVGCVSDEQIVGRIFARIWPLNEIGPIHRGDVPSPIASLMTEAAEAGK